MRELADKEQQVMQLFKQHKILRPKEVKALGLPAEYLWRLAKKGLLIQLDKGLYVKADYDFTEHLSLLEVSKKVPDGIVCLLSALHFYGLSDTQAFEVWMAVKPGRYHPKIDSVQTRFVHVSGPALTEGVITHVLEGVPVNMYSPAKTVADCFKFRRLVGLDVAMTALKQGLHDKQFNLDQVWRFARSNRVDRVMMPYLEMLG